MQRDTVVAAEAGSRPVPRWMVRLNRVLIDFELPLEERARRLDALCRNRVLIADCLFSTVDAASSN